MSKFFGDIAGVFEGDIFKNKQALKDKGIHHDQYKGIAGLQDEGAYSVVLSGGYTDSDNGNKIIYTGEGGKPGKDGVVTEDQKFNAGNKALAKNKIEGLPVRVSRKLHDGHFQYAGLFRVDDYWESRTKYKKLFWQYRLIKIEPVVQNNILAENEVIYDSAVKRVESVVQRQVRDSNLSRKVKAIYDHQCQVCGVRLETKAGFYAEGAHIKPLGKPHNGPDELTNILCLCPNHHVLFDNGGITLNDDLSINDLSCEFDQVMLQVNSELHSLDVECIRYHRLLK